MDRTGLLIILSSPSGAGKSTLARRLIDWDPTLSFSVSATTRAPRPARAPQPNYANPSFVIRAARSCAKSSPA